MKKKKHFACIVYFYLGLGKISIWFYLGLTLNLIYYKFFEVLPLRRCTFNFRQRKNIYNWYTKILSKLKFSLIGAFKNKMIQSKSTIINIMKIKKENVNNQLNFTFLTNNIKG